jgi:hypothetical protein
MPQIWILYPMTALVALTFAVGAVLLWMRVRAVRRGEINPRYFLLNRGKAPDALTRVDQHFTNLFELPVLFYALVLVLYVTASVTPLQLALAWAFVLTRVLHALIHTTVNRLRARMLAFLAGALLLMLGWGRCLMGLLGA